MSNIITRSVSGAVFLAIILVALLLNSYLFAATLLFIMLVMMHEFYTITMGRKFMLSRILAFISAASFFIVTFLVCSEGISPRWLAVSVLPLVAMMASSIHGIKNEEIADFAFFHSGLLYIALPLAGSNLIVFNDGLFNGLPLLGFLVLIWASDVGAYLFGISFGQKPGRKKLCPSVSPKKSWAGFWGGFFTTILVGATLGITGIFPYPVIHCIILSAIMNVAAVYGDLFESKWKRGYDVKDSGTIMPGHGGLLDRFDSAIVAIPAGAIYLMAAGLL